MDNATKSSSNLLEKRYLDGFATKEYSTGHKIECNWIKGAPEGKALLTTPDESATVKFKQGVIKRIFTDKEMICIHFPYKFIKKTDGFDEVFEDSSKSWYSVLKLPMKYNFCEKAVNRKLENVKKIIVSSNVSYFGEYFEGMPLGHGILLDDEEVWVGSFNGINFVGYKGIKLMILKGSFDFDRLNGFGTIKLMHYNVKYKGNFVNDRKVGHFNVFFDDFRAEVTFENDKNLNPVKYFKKNKFLLETHAQKLIFLCNENCFYIPEMIELHLKFSKNIQENMKYSQEAFRKNPKQKKVKRKPKIINVDYLDWECFEKSLLKNCDHNSKEEERKVGDTLQKHFYNENEFYIGDFIHGKRENFGTFFKMGKILYKGYWKADVFHGKGELFLHSFKLVGNWEMGILKDVKHVLKLDI